MYMKNNIFYKVLPSSGTSVKIIQFFGKNQLNFYIPDILSIP